MPVLIRCTLKCDVCADICGAVIPVDHARLGQVLTGEPIVEPPWRLGRSKLQIYCSDECEKRADEIASRS